MSTHLRLVFLDLISQVFFIVLLRCLSGLSDSYVGHITALVWSHDLFWARISGFGLFGPLTWGPLPDWCDSSFVLHLTLYKTKDLIL